MSYGTHDEYFANCPEEVAARLRSIQAEVEAMVPDSVRCIGYKMPAFRRRRIFFYFGAFKQHIGVYPPLVSDRLLIEETQRFRGAGGNLSFPLNEALPRELIGRVASALAAQYD